MVITTENIKQKRGYKQTEIGLIPEDWEVKKLSMIAQFINGSAHEQFIDDKGDYIVVNSKFISTEGKVVKYSKKDLSPLFIGDILMVMSDIPHGKALAKCFLVNENGKYTLNQRICTFRPHVLDTHYLFYQLNRNQYFLNFDSGVGQTNLKKSEVLDCPVVIPPTKSEQRAIAAALSDVDALITSLDKLIAKKRDIKQATMQQLLTGKTRLPGFDKELRRGYKQTELGEFPDDWEPIPLGFLSAFITKGATPTTYGFNWVNDGILFLRSECVSDQGLDLTQSMFITPQAHNVLKRGEVRAGDILITITGNVGRAIYLGDGFDVANINQHIARIRIIDTNVDANYIFHFLSQFNIRKYYNSITTGQAYPQISLKQVRDTRIPIPPTKFEQTSIATILSDMDAEIVALERRRDKTRALKQGMMQELLTGKTRLT